LAALAIFVFFHVPPENSVQPTSLQTNRKVSSGLQPSLSQVNEIRTMQACASRATIWRTTPGKEREPLSADLADPPPTFVKRREKIEKRRQEIQAELTRLAEQSKDYVQQ
jgi:hypothetical protein